MIYPYLREKDVMPIIKEVMKLRPQDTEKLQRMLADISYVNDQFVAVSRDKDTINGMMIASVESFEGDLCAFIQYCFSKKSKEAGKMLEALKKWALERGLTRIIFMSDRNPLAWEKKYKFKEIYKVMQMEIKNVRFL